MIELIKQELAKHADSNLGSEAAIDVIAQGIVLALEPMFALKVPTNDAEQTQLDLLKVTYTPIILNLIRTVGTQLSSPEDTEIIYAVYNDILNLAKTRNNGTMLLALIQATITLLGSAASQVSEMDKLNAEHSAEETGSTEVAVAGV